MAGEPRWGVGAGENEVKRTAGGPGRETAAQPAAAAFPPRPADRRRTPLRCLQPALRAGLHPGHHQPAFRRVDRGVRIGTPHRRAAGLAHPPRPYPGDERRELQAQAQPGERRSSSPGRIRQPIGRARSRPPPPTQPASVTLLLNNWCGHLRWPMTSGGTLLLRPTC